VPTGNGTSTGPTLGQVSWRSHTFRERRWATPYAVSSAESLSVCARMTAFSTSVPDCSHDKHRQLSQSTAEGSCGIYSYAARKCLRAMSEVFRLPRKTLARLPPQVCYHRKCTQRWKKEAALFEERSVTFGLQRLSSNSHATEVLQVGNKLEYANYFVCRYRGAPSDVELGYSAFHREYRVVARPMRCVLQDFQGRVEVVAAPIDQVHRGGTRATEMNPL
jgi:hypothetical protein